MNFDIEVFDDEEVMDGIIRKLHGDVSYKGYFNMY